MPKSTRLALLLIPGLAAGAQLPPVFPVGLEMVNLTITVWDREGKLVTDLGRGDFAVYEDGRPQQVLVYAQALQPGEHEKLALDLGLLLDTSESMLKELKLSQQAATRFLEAVPRARELYTILFAQDILVSRYDSEHQQGLFERIHAVKGGGNTALYDAIAVYLSRVEDAPGRKVLVLFSDGEDSTSSTSLSECLRMVQSSQVVIYAIAFSGGFAQGSTRAVTSKAFLNQVAHLSGGEVFPHQGSRGLPAVYDKILGQLEAQYVLGYVSDNPRRDGQFRKLRVELKRDDLKVRHRTGYLVPAEPKPGKESRRRPSP